MFWHKADVVVLSQFHEHISCLVVTSLAAGIHLGIQVGAVVLVGCSVVACRA